MNNNRKKDFSGVITDSAGNVISNTVVTVNRITPQGAYQITKAVTDEDGKFTTIPLPPGKYQFYESNINLQEAYIDVFDYVPCYKAKSDIITLKTDGKSFIQEASKAQLLEFYTFIQIEDASVNTRNGNLFPLDSLNISQLSNIDSWYEDFSLFFSMEDSDQITVSRFDIEFHSDNSILGTITWSGLPGVKFNNFDNIYLPLDYKSMRFNSPKSALFENDNKTLASISISVVSNGPADNYISVSSNIDNIETFYNSISIGDVLKINDNGTDYYYILHKKEFVSGDYRFYLEELDNSNYSTQSVNSLGTSNIKLISYQGLFNNMVSSENMVAQNFTVFENHYFKFNNGEIYNY